MRAHASSLRQLAGDPGQTLIEYVVTLIAFLLLFLGIVDFGRALYTYHFVAQAARMAARWAAVNGSTCNSDATNGSSGSCSAPVSCTSTGCSLCTGSGCSPATTADVQNFVKMTASTAIDQNDLSTTPTWQASQWTSQGVTCNSPYQAPGCVVQVSVSYPFHFLIPLVHSGSVTMSSTSEMVIAH